MAASFREDAVVDAALVGVREDENPLST